MNAYDSEESSGLISRRSLTHVIIGGSVSSVLASRDAKAAAVGTVGAPGSGGNVQDYVEIQRLIYRYAMAIDNRDGDAWADCYAPGAPLRAGADELVKFHRNFEYTMHNMLDQAYTVTGNSATGTVYCVVTYVKNRGGKLTKFDAYSRYENDELVKQGDRWLFLKREWKCIFSTEEVPVYKGVPPDFYKDVK